MSRIVLNQSPTVQGIATEREIKMQKWTLALLLLGLAAYAAATEREQNGVIYDDYDEGADTANTDQENREEDEAKVGGVREKRQAVNPYSWMGAPFLHATCRLQPTADSTVQGYLYLFQKRPWDYVRVKGSMWGMVERKERFEVGIHAGSPTTPGDCDEAGDTLLGAVGVQGSLGTVKAKGYGRATGISRGNRMVTLESGHPNSIIGRSIVVSSLASRQRVACCTILEQ